MRDVDKQDEAHVSTEVIRLLKLYLTEALPRSGSGGGEELRVVYGSSNKRVVDQPPQALCHS